LQRHPFLTPPINAFQHTPADGLKKIQRKTGPDILGNANVVLLKKENNHFYIRMGKPTFAPNLKNTKWLRTELLQ
jgi:hypothetical protein